MRRPCAGGGSRGRRRACAGRVERRAARRSDDAERLSGHRRRGHNRRDAGAPDLRAGAGLDSRGPAAGSGRDPARQDQHTGADPRRRDRQFGLWPYQQPIRTRPNTRRVQRWSGRSHRLRRIAVRHGQRYGRQHPSSRALQRDRRYQAELRARTSDRTHRPVRDGRNGRLHAERTDGALRRGPRPHATYHLGA